MTVYIVSAIVTRYSYADCVDKWFKEPHILGIYTSRERAEAILNEVDEATMQEVETDVFLNDCREEVCENPFCERSTCKGCKEAYTMLRDSGISLI